MKTKFIYSKSSFLIAILSIFGLLAGCSDNSSNPTSSNSNGNNTTTNNIGISMMQNDNLSDYFADTLIITEAKGLVNEIEIENQSPGISIHVTPFVIYFNSNGSIQEIIGGQIPAGNYSKIKFKIHKPEENETPPDPEFKEGTSGNLRYSFIIKGTYNGNSFIYKSKQSANLLINLSSPVSFSSTKRNITVLFNKKSWFYKNGLKDPRNPSNENEIDDNIKSSFKSAFLDDDKNGIPDGK